MMNIDVLPIGTKVKGNGHDIEVENTGVILQATVIITKNKQHVWYVVQFDGGTSTSTENIFSEYVVKA